MTESNSQDPQDRGPEARQNFIREQLAEVGDAGLSTTEIANLVMAAGLCSRRQTVMEDLGAMRDVGLMRVDGRSQWYLIQEKKDAEPADPTSRRELFRKAVVDRIGELNVAVDAGTATPEELDELAFAERWLQDLGFAGPTVAVGEVPVDGQHRVDALVDNRTVDDMPEEDGYSLVLPFVVCRSEGGPFDDVAFVSGVQVGEILAKLEMLKVAGGVESDRFWVNKELRKQLDMVGMHRGFVMHADEVDDPECESMWVWFEKSDQV